MPNPHELLVRRPSEQTCRRLIEDGVVVLSAATVFSCASSAIPCISTVGPLLIAASIWFAWWIISGHRGIKAQCRQGVDRGLVIGLLAMPVLTAAQAAVTGGSGGSTSFVHAVQCSFLFAMRVAPWASAPDRLLPAVGKATFTLLFAWAVNAPTLLAVSDGARQMMAARIAEVRLHPISRSANPTADTAGVC